MVSKFQFKEHTIDKLLVNNTIENAHHDDRQIDYFANFQYHYENGSWHGEIALGFRDVPDIETGDALFEVIGRGIFAAKGEQNAEQEKEFVKMLKINGSSTLIPIVRAALVSACSLMGHNGQFTIPNINVFNLSWRELPFVQ